VTVNSPEGTSTGIAFTVNLPAPAGTGFLPAQGSIGTPVTITGRYFSGTTKVAFNGASAAFNVVDDSHITTAVPASATAGAIVVTTPSGSWTSPTLFMVKVLVTINQTPDNLLSGIPYGFTALVTGTPVGTVTWSIAEGTSGGIIDPSGTYTAPATPGTYHIMATSTADATASATAVVPVHDACLDPTPAASGAISATDLAYFVRALGSKTGDATYNTLADFNGDGVIDDKDLTLFLGAF
jgi:hypothetical protein